MKNSKPTYKGELYLCDFGKNHGSIQNGIRPVIILQEDTFSKKSPTTIVAPITTVIKKSYLPSHVYLGKRFGLRNKSMVLLEQIRTVNKSDLIVYIGKVTSEKVLNDLWRSVKKTMGFWDNKRNQSYNSINLCSTCLKSYIHSERYIVNQMRKVYREKEICDVCKNAYGYPYSLKERRKSQ